MSGSTQSQESFLSRRGFFGWATSLAGALGMAPLVMSAKAVSSPTTSSPAGSSDGEDYYAKLGVPTIINAAYSELQFWAGRAHQLEGQALGPIQNPIEMDHKLDECVTKLNKIPGYRQQFRKVFGTDVTSENVAKAIAAFERTILSGNAPYDKLKAGDENALSAAAKRGMKVFFGKGHCSACHVGPAVMNRKRMCSPRSGSPRRNQHGGNDYLLCLRSRCF